MKITIQHYDKTHTLEQPDDTDLNGTIESFKSMLVCMGFHPQSIDEHFDCELMWFKSSHDEWQKLDDDNSVVDGHPFLQNNKEQ